MTITPATMYWFTRLDVLCGFFNGLTFFSAFGILILIFLTVSYYTENYDDEEVVKRIKHWWALVSFVFIFAISGLIFVPTTKEMAMIYVVPQITESQIVKQDIPELYDLGVNALKDWLKQTKGGDNE